MEPEVQTPVASAESAAVSLESPHRITYFNRGDTQSKTMLIDVNAIPPLGNNIRGLQRFFNEVMHKAYTVSHAHKYTMCYLHEEAKYLEYIPRENIPTFMGGVTAHRFLGDLLEGGPDYGAVGYVTEGDYTYFYFSISPDFSDMNQVSAVKVHRLTKTREESYQLWYGGLFNVVLKGIQSLGLRFNSTEIEIPLTSGGEELSKFGVSNVPQNVLGAVDLNTVMNNRDTYLNGESFLNDVISSPAFALDWVSLNADLTSQVPEAETPEWLRRAQAYVISSIARGFPEKSEWGMNKTFVNYLKTGTGFDAKVNETLQVHFKNSMVDNRIIDTAYDMDTRDSVDLNKKLRLIEAHNPPEYKKLVLSSNPMSLRNKVNQYVASNRLAA